MSKQINSLKWPIPERALPSPLIGLSQRFHIGAKQSVKGPFQQALKSVFPGNSPLLFGNPTHFMHQIRIHAQRIMRDGMIMIFEGLGNRNPSDISTARLLPWLQGQTAEAWKKNMVPVIVINHTHTHAYTKDTQYCSFERTHPGGPQEIRNLAVKHGWPHTFCENEELADELTRVLQAIRDGQLAQFR